MSAADCQLWSRRGIVLRLSSMIDSRRGLRSRGVPLGSPHPNKRRRVSFPAARLGPVRRGGGPLAQRAGLVAAAAAPPAAALLARQALPRVVAEAAAAAHRPIDRLRAHRRAHSGQIGADRVRRPAQTQPVVHLAGQRRARFELGGLGTQRPQPGLGLRCLSVIDTLDPAAAAQLAINRRRMPAEPFGNVISAHPRRSHRINTNALQRAHPRCHTEHLHW